MNVRLRFAVDPAGWAGIGSLRTLVFNWLFVRHHHGTLILCIHDIDQDVSGPAGEMVGGLRWLGIDWDEGPYKGGACGPYSQSERLALYRRYARQLVETGRAYPCYCSPRRPSGNAALAACTPERCSNHCWALSGRQRAHFEARGVMPAIRFKCPQVGETAVLDRVFRQQSWPHAALDDVILLWPDGVPTLYLSDPVDDHLTKVTHVIRDVDRLAYTPYYLLVSEAFGWAPPEFAHLPSIAFGTHAPDRSLHTYRDEGYLAPAIINHLARLGWSPRGKRDLESAETLANRFDLGRVSHRPVLFDIAHLDWFNHRYLGQLAAAELEALLVPRWQAAYGLSHRAAGTALSPEEWRRKLALAVQDELHTLAQVPARVRFCFADRLELAADTAGILDQPYSPDVLRAFVDGIASLEPFTYDPIDQFVTDLRYRFKASYGIRSRDVMFVIRAALTGRHDGPCLVVACELLGRQRCTGRAQMALERLL